MVRYLRDTWVSTYCFHIRLAQSVEQINADGDRDRWFNAQEALEYGFVDHIRESALDVAGGGGTQA